MGTAAAKIVTSIMAVMHTVAEELMEHGGEGHRQGRLKGRGISIYHHGMEIVLIGRLS